MIPDRIYLIGISKDKIIYKCTTKQESVEDIEYIRADRIKERIEEYKKEGFKVLTQLKNSVISHIRVSHLSARLTEIETRKNELEWILKEKI